MVSDGFLWWTLESASKFNIPRFVFYGMCYYSCCVTRAVAIDRLLSGLESNDELITVPPLPWIKVTRNDFEPSISEGELKGRKFEFTMETIIATLLNSYGIIFNSFYELEPLFDDYWNRECTPKAWSVGPLCLAEPPKGRTEPHNKPKWVQWLDKKLDQGSSVLYVAFGSQAEISPAQLKEIATGLEESKANFLWVIRKCESEISDGFEERVKDRGIVNSVLESICAGVPILAWPMMADQPLNARMVVKEIKVGLRVETCDGSVRGFVKWEGLEKMVKELMEGEKGKEVRKKSKELAEMAKKAMAEGGSSKCTLDLLINKTCGKKT
nr:udp-glycosyltransferase 90a1 [Quercus suber]